MHTLIVKFSQCLHKSRFKFFISRKPVAASFPMSTQMLGKNSFVRTRREIKRVVKLNGCQVTLNNRFGLFQTSVLLKFGDEFDFNIENKVACVLSCFIDLNCRHSFLIIIFRRSPFTARELNVQRSYTKLILLFI